MKFKINLLFAKKDFFFFNELDLLIMSWKQVFWKKKSLKTSFKKMNFQKKEMLKFMKKI